MDKSLFFLFITFLCIWLILDEFVGKGYIGNLVDNLIGGGSGTSITDKAKKTAEKAAESKAKGKSKTAEASKNHKKRR